MNELLPAQACILKSLQIKAQCPVCRKSLGPHQLRMEVLSRRKLWTEKVKCPWDGCKWKVFFLIDVFASYWIELLFTRGVVFMAEQGELGKDGSSLEAHANNCDHHLIPCKHTIRGCQTQLVFKV